MNKTLAKNCFEKGQKILKLEKQLKEKQEEIDKYQDAIEGITSWLSASINDNCCRQYIDACNKCFGVDSQFKGELYKPIDISKYPYR